MSEKHFHEGDSCRSEVELHMKVEQLEKNLKEDKTELAKHEENCERYRKETGVQITKIEKEIVKINTKYDNDIPQIKADLRKLAESSQQNKQSISVINAKNVMIFTCISMGIAIIGLLLRIANFI